MARSLYAKFHRRFGPKPSGQKRYEKTRQKIGAALQQLPVLSHIEQRERLAQTGTPCAPSGKTVAVVGAGFAGLSAAYTFRHPIRVGHDDTQR